MSSSSRTAIVTGATRGIGRGLFEHLARAGVRVATIHHRDEPAAERFRQHAREARLDCHIERLDLRDLDALAGFVGRVQERLGRIDYLVNNVGVDVFKSIEAMSWEEWRLSQDIILNAPVFLARQVLPIMRAARFGRIVNLGASSKNYLSGAAGLGPFGIHKAALAVFTKTLALEEIGHGITVNMVAPGSTAEAGTNPEEKRIPVASIPLGRRVRIGEVVAGIAYFLSDEAGSVTGQCLGINGGLST